MSHSKRLSVCALVPYPEQSVPGQRYRIEQWRPFLEKEGIEVDFLSFADRKLAELLYQPGRVVAKSAKMTARFIRRFSHVRAARRYDAVFIHRAACLAGPALHERLIALLGKPVIYDFDDAIFMLHTTVSNRRFGWLKFPGKTAAICRLSAHVVVGNSFLADYARRHNSNVTVIPSSIDTEVYQPAARSRANRRVVVGWTGSSTSQTHLEMFAPVLSQIVARQEVEIRVISDREPQLEGVPFTWRRWSAAAETEDLSRFDIGIMPMPDDEWSRGKCSMKALQYMAMAVPAVCSAVGMNSEVIEHNRNGMLATTPEEWIASLESLIEDPQLRQRMGAEARKTVEERYSMRESARLFARAVREAVRRTAPAAALREDEQEVTS